MHVRHKQKPQHLLKIFLPWKILLRQLFSLIILLPHIHVDISFVGEYTTMSAYVGRSSMENECSRQGANFRGSGWVGGVEIAWSVGRTLGSSSEDSGFDCRQDRRETFFFSRVNFLCWLLFSVCSTPMLLKWHVKEPGHSAQRASGRLHIGTRTPLTQRRRTGLTRTTSGRSPCKSVSQLVSSLFSLFVRSFVRSLISQLVSWLVGWLVGQLVSQLVSRCFELSQPQRIISGLNTNFNLFPIYSFHKSLYQKSFSFLSQTTAQILSTISEHKTRKKQ